MRKHLYRTIFAAATSFMISQSLVAQPSPVGTGDGRMGLGTPTPDRSAILDLTSSTTGFLMPRMTTAQRDAIPSPAPGLAIFNTDENEFQFNGGTGIPSWVPILDSSNAGSIAWGLMGNAGLNPAINFLGTTDNQPLIFRTNNAEVLRLTPGGNVGVGSTAPTFRLETAGDVGPSANATWSLGSDSRRWKDLWVSGASLHIGDPGNDAIIGYNTAASPNELTFDANADATPEVVMEEDGDVGIGILTPTAQLHVVETGGFTQNVIEGTTNGMGTAVVGTTTGGGNAGRFEINNAPSSADALVAATDGTGDAVFGEATGNGTAGRFEINNASNSSTALVATTNGTGDALVGEATGGGSAGRFEIENAASAADALVATTDGTGSAASFENSNAGNTAPTVNVAQGGLGNGIAVQLTNASNGGRGIDVAQSGVGPGVFATSAGGNAIWGITSSVSAAGVIGDNTFGEAVVGRNRGGDGVGAVVGRNDSSGYGVRGFNTKDGVGVIGQAGISGGTGTAGRFENVNAANVTTTLAVESNGIGNGIDVELTNASNGGRGVNVTQAGVGPGVFATSAGGNAVWGITSSISAAGVIGDNTFGEAVVGRNRGGNGVGAVVGRNDSSGYGVRGFNTKNGIGVIGQAGISGGTGTAGRFENVNAANSSPALVAVTNGSGPAVQTAGAVDVHGNGGAAGELRIYEPSGDGTDYTAFQAQAQSGNVTYTLPPADGNSGDALTTDGSGGLTWTAPSSGLTFPYSATESTSSPMLSLTQTGNSNVGSFVINNPASVASVLNLNHNGIGNGLAIQLSNASNGGRGVDVTQSGVGPGVFATSAGGNAVWGITSSISAAGVIGDNTFGEAVVGRNRGGNGVGAVVGRNDSSGYGVRGFNTKNGYGVLGQAGISGGTGTAGRFENVNAANTSDALQVVTNSSGNAARFTGNVVVNGNMTVSGTVAKGGGTFKIDHPLDPKNQYLYHSFVESDQMMNIYDGIVTLNAKGEATVTMPKWFEALNRDFRYQLTAIGAPGPGLYIAQMIKGNTFRIAGGTSGMQVSWQVTGVRHDAYAEKNRVQVEVQKPEGERGTYLHPEAFGVDQPKDVKSVWSSPSSGTQLQSESAEKAPAAVRTDISNGKSGSTIQSAAPAAAKTAKPAAVRTDAAKSGNTIHSAAPIMQLPAATVPLSSSTDGSAAASTSAPASRTSVAPPASLPSGSTGTVKSTTSTPNK